VIYIDPRMGRSATRRPLTYAAIAVMGRASIFFGIARHRGT